MMIALREPVSPRPLGEGMGGRDSCCARRRRTSANVRPPTARAPTLRRSRREMPSQKRVCEPKIESICPPKKSGFFQELRFFMHVVLMGQHWIGGHQIVA